MKTYTVTEIAEMLKTNPETVRRWIRVGKLQAEQFSRKGGNIVTEQSLSAFLKTAPKYAGIAAGTIGALSVPGLIAGVPAITAAFLSSMIMQQALTSEKIKKSQIPISEVVKFIKTSITSSNKKISSKKEEIRKLSLEIQAEEQQIQDLKELLKKINSLQNNHKENEVEL